MSFLKRSHNFWIALFLLAIGAVFTAVGANIVLQERQYRSEGRATEGTVLVKSIERATRSGPSGTGTQTHYKVTYRFTADDGRTYQGTDDTPVAVWERLREQEAVTVQYVGSNPMVNRIAGETSNALAYVFPALGLGIVTIGATLLTKSVATARRKARVLAEGTAADATVSAVEETNFRINRQRMWVVRYQYRDYSGRTHEGKSEYMAAEKAAAWKRGDAIRVRFDPQQPAVSVWVE